MRSKILLQALFLVTFCCSVATAQTNPPPPAPTPVDSFGDILLTDWKARLDNFAAELRDTPTSRGYIVVYPEMNKFPGWPFRKANTAMNHLITLDGIAPTRLAVVNGGYRDQVTFELWKIAAGAELPITPSDFSLMIAGEKTPIPFDRFPIFERGDPDSFEYEDSASYYPDAEGLYDTFLSVLKRDPGLRGCVIAYSARRNKRGADRKLAARVKMAIMKMHSMDVSRIIAIGGGRRKQKLVELWIVPPGSELPKPTPTVRPTRRKRR